MVDNFEAFQTQLDSPGARHFAVTPSDDTDFTIQPRSLFVGGGGNVAVVDIDGTVATYTVPAGFYLLMRASRVNATGTTATNIIGIY